jgi:hypothetical protein
MADQLKIHDDYAEGGAGVGTKTTRHPGIKDVIHGLIDDIAAGSVATIASPDAVDLATAITLVNEIKAALNAAGAASATKTVVKG